ncbi:type I polyketide synthase [Candidatus Laterigemmans baculatus]|uniref:type I polyketide synthase n=1 Tax=Candidatus Laterigemmans baculatus TaxID=2770505 RepID=UPI0013D96517|nr:type I polyketide synthase [Candidatus Laterigemmans baculatus]
MIDLAQRLARLSPHRLQLLQRQLEETAPVAEPVAIIGLGCRFPGAADLASYWELISAGRRAIGELPAERWDAEQVAAAAGSSEQAARCGRFGGFLDAIDQFDAHFFGISPREAAKMDPQQRLLLEVTWQALEHAGLAPERLAGSTTGVFVGIGAADYAKVPFHFDDYYGQIDVHSGTGNALSIAANRMSYFFDWHGPSMSVDTACSSALVALHLAVKNLQNGEANLAVAGGVNLMLSPEATLAFSKAGMLSPDGHCRPFDSRANGYVRGEGAGVVVLKRLSDAVADGDRILATIRGTAVNQDGRTSGISAPNSQSQVAVIQAALRQAGLDPDAVSYVEAHGTGTPLGDPIELEALRQVYEGPSSSQPCYLSSVKANIGHLETAAGIASVIKVVLMMQAGELAPQADFAELNPHITLGKGRLRIAQERMPWHSAGGPRRAGISSFGFGGTNAHMVLEQATLPEPAPLPATPPVKLLAVSAKTPSALQRIAEQYADYLEQHPNADLDAFCFSANSGRNHFHYGVTVAAADPPRMLHKLRELAESRVDEADEARHRRGFRAPKVAFVFTGQGGQYLGMGRELFATQPFFRHTLERCDALLREPLGASILEIMHAGEDDERIHQTLYTQPALFAIEYSLAQLWRSWGIEPSALLGHSVGEFVAATLADVYTLEDGLRLIAERARLMQDCSGDGAMAAVAASGETVERMLAEARIAGAGPTRTNGQINGAATAPRQLENGRSKSGPGEAESIEIAAFNGPANTVVSGDRGAVERFVERCNAEGLKAKFLPVSHAFHSHLMDAVLDDFERFAAAIPARSPRVPVVSNLTGDWLQQPPDGRYWREHLRRSVRFEQGMRTLLETEPDFVLEAGPSPTLLAMGRQFIDRPTTGWLPSLRAGQGDWQVLTGSLAELYSRGANIRWSQIYGSPAPAKLVLPGYRFERKRHWYDEAGQCRGLGGLGPNSTARGDSRSRSGLHPLLGAEVATTFKTRLFETLLEEHAPGYLSEHRVQGSAVTPAAAYLEQALAAADALFGAGTHTVSDVSIQQAMFLPTDASRHVQFTTSEEPTESCSFRIHSRPAESNDRDAWTMHAYGKLARGSSGASPASAAATATQSLHTTGFAGTNGHASSTRYPMVISGEQFYERMRQCGLDYGPRFRVIDELRRGDDGAVAELQMTESVRQESSQHRIHPAILDGCLQAMAGLVPLAADGTPSNRLYLPTAIGRFRLLGDPLRAARIEVRRSDSADNSPLETLHGDVTLLDADGHVLAELEQVRVQSLGATAPRTRDAAEWLYQLDWQEAPLESPESTLAEPQPGAGQRCAGQRWIVTAPSRSSVATELAAAIRHQGGRCVLLRSADRFAQLDDDTFEIDPLSSDDYARAFETAAASEASSASWSGIVHLASLGDFHGDSRGGSHGDDLEQASRRVLGGAMQLLRQTVRGPFRSPPPIWLCTQGFQAISPKQVAEQVTNQAAEETLATEVDPLQAAVWGMGRTAALESVGGGVRLIDLDPQASDAEGAAGLLGELVAAATRQVSAKEQGEQEDQVAFRATETQDAIRYAARLVKARFGDAASGEDAEGGKRRELRLPAAPFRLRSREAGSFDALAYASFELPKLAPDQVAIEVHSAGLNFSDVLKAMGLYPGLTDQEPPLGIECSGVVTAVGSEVTRFRVGDEVMGVAPSSFASHAVTAEYALARKPASLSHDEASTIPITFLTAHYALRWLGRLGRGERVLIHAAAGGVGQAAIQIAEHVGAEVFATAGSDEKREFLASLGVSHVFNSRTLEFADQILHATDRYGVDVVLNSLPGDVIPKSLSILAAYGRFLEIGKTDIYQDRMIGLAPFQDNLSYSAIDLDRMLRQRPDDIRRLFSEVMELFEQGVYRPLPHKTFAAPETATAFRYMAQRKNIGKVVVSLSPQDRPAAAVCERKPTIHAEASYLITGGLGALGLRLAQWLAEQGARHLLLLSRRSPSDDQQRRLAELPPGTRVACLQADVADRKSLEGALAQIPADFPPLGGILHAAGALADGLLYDMSLEQLERALRPKVQGAWNLHALSQTQPLDFFVLFSSIAAVLGSPGQANYAAGNAFLDGLAALRRSRGLPATAINWGPWAEGGMAVTADPDSQLSDRGMRLLDPEACLSILDRLLKESESAPVQLAVMDVDWSALARQFPRRRPPLFEAFASQWEDPAAAGDPGKVDREFLGRFAATAAEEQQPLLQNYLTAELARIMGMDPADLDPEQLLNVVGVDSLMAMELKTNLEAQLDIELPMAALMERPSIASITGTMLASLTGEGLGEALDDDAPGSTASVSTSKGGSSLVPLQTQAALPALYCLHPVGGDLRCYRDLAQHLGRSRCVTTIRPRGADAGTVPHESVEEMAEEYAELIRSAQPQGPYLLSGWSTGGIFAYEIARQLKAAGHAVELLFIDTPTSEILQGVDLSDDARFLHDLVNFSNWFSGAKMRIEYAELKAMQPDQATDRILREMKQQRVLPEGTTRSDLQRRIELCRAHLRAALAYQVQPLGQRIRMYRPKQSAVLSLATGRHLGDDLGWGPILGEDLEIERVGGDHFSMLTGRHGQQLAETIGRHLDSTVPADVHTLDSSRSVLL